MLTRKNIGQILRDHEYLFFLAFIFDRPFRHPFSTCLFAFRDSAYCNSSTTLSTPSLSLSNSSTRAAASVSVEVILSRAADVLRNMSVSSTLDRPFFSNNALYQPMSYPPSLLPPSV